MYLEVNRIDPEHEGVQLAEGEEAAEDVVHLIYGFEHATHDGGSVLPDGGRTGAQVLPVGEVGLGLRIHKHHPWEKEGKAEKW